MKPEDLKTAKQCHVAAAAVFDARVVIACRLKSLNVGSAVDQELYDLEIAYYRRAAELSMAAQKKAKRVPPSEYVGKPGLRKGFRKC